MKSKVSELMDGELDAGEAGAALAALRDEGEAREAWRSYHLIGDVLRDTRGLSPDFAARVAERIAREPTVLAPAAAPPARPSRWAALTAVAAGVAGVALVGSLALTPQPQSPAPVAQAPAAAPVARAEPVRVPPPSATDDYLLAHQRYSPRISLPGVASYVRTVSAATAARRQP